MTDKTTGERLAERLVSMPWWEWRDGIIVGFPDEGTWWPLWAKNGDNEVWHYDERGWCGTRGLTVNLDDPATQGVLLGWCRELWPSAYVRPCYGRWRLSIKPLTMAVQFNETKTIAEAYNYGEVIAKGLIALHRCA